MRKSFKLIKLPIKAERNTNIKLSKLFFECGRRDGQTFIQWTKFNTNNPDLPFVHNTIRCIISYKCGERVAEKYCNSL